MAARIDWLNDGIDRMIAGRHPATPVEWGGAGSILIKDVELLRQAAQFNILRSGASQPDPDFISQTHRRILAEAAAEK